MAVIETISAIITITSLIATIYFKRHQCKRFVKRQCHLLRTKFRAYRDRKATARNRVNYMPIQELETVGLKHADNLEELEREILDSEFSTVEVIDLQAPLQNTEKPNEQPIQSQPKSVDSQNSSSTEVAIDNNMTFYTAQIPDESLSPIFQLPPTSPNQ